MPVHELLIVLVTISKRGHVVVYWLRVLLGRPAWQRWDHNRFIISPENLVHPLH